MLLVTSSIFHRREARHADPLTRWPAVVNRAALAGHDFLFALRAEIAADPVSGQSSALLAAQSARLIRIAVAPRVHAFQVHSSAAAVHMHRASNACPNLTDYFPDR